MALNLSLVLRASLFWVLPLGSPEAGDEQVSAMQGILKGDDKTLHDNLQICRALGFSRLLPAFCRFCNLYPGACHHVLPPLGRS